MTELFVISAGMYYVDTVMLDGAWSVEFLYAQSFLKTNKHLLGLDAFNVKHTKRPIPLLFCHSFGKTKAVHFEISV